VAPPGFGARPSSRAISSRRRRISSNPASVSKMEVLVMDHLCGSWGWFDCDQKLANAERRGGAVTGTELEPDHPVDVGASLISEDDHRDIGA
jgi:hypothetical protein